ncbi:hypothetical protein NDU88_003129 [Pleurodeles waltl]|uniref:Uncharacterized protein n=1 Tax=Pleurodeles waltl TaxID=8319 RepID=A0AAV7NH88_PLEWA|nr:hypothetical protein NDU88_003129 [Pleurodeles waltl]
MESTGAATLDATPLTPVSPSTVINKISSKLRVTVFTSTNKRAKKDPPSPIKVVDTISMELLLEEIRVLKLYMEDTNKQLQILDDKWSLVENRDSCVERRVEVLEDSVASIPSVQSKVTMLKKHAEDREKRPKK